VKLFSVDVVEKKIQYKIRVFILYIFMNQEQQEKREKQQPIYKVKLMQDGQVKAIVVFRGPYSKDLLAEEERGQNGKVYYDDQFIFYDDSIATIKVKIINAFKTHGIQLNQDGIYLYMKKRAHLDPIKIFSLLSKKGKVPLTRERIAPLFINLYGDAWAEETWVSKKTTYEYSDLLQHFKPDALYTVSHCFSIRTVYGDDQPYFLPSWPRTKSWIQGSVAGTTAPCDGKLLLESGAIVDNTLYFVDAMDILSGVGGVTDERNANMDIKKTMQTYYPLLKNVTTVADYEKRKGASSTSLSMATDPAFLHEMETVDLLQSMYKTKKKELKYVPKGTGISSVEFVIRNQLPIQFPLNMLFKVVHANERNPFIKYNPSSKQENMLRLYSTQTAKNGRRIPFLEKADLFRLLRTVGKNRSLTFYFKEVKKGFTLVLELEEGGNITIACETAAPLSMAALDTVLVETTAPLFQEISAFLEQIGYKLPEFKSIADAHIEIISMRYETVVQIDEAVQLEPLLPCLSSVFVLDSVMKKEIGMKYKRVSYYNALSAQEAFVVEQVKTKEGLRGDDLIASLVSNFNMSEVQARTLLMNMINELELGRGFKKDRVFVNPGFKMVLYLDSIGSKVKVVVDKINHIEYLKTVPIYLDSLIRLTQDPGSTDVPIEQINALCRKVIPQKPVLKKKETLVLQDEVDAEPQDEVEAQDKVEPQDEVDAEPQDEVEAQDKVEAKLDIIEEEDLEPTELPTEIIKTIEPNEESKIKKALDLFFDDLTEEDDEEEDLDLEEDVGESKEGKEEEGLGLGLELEDMDDEFKGFFEGGTFGADDQEGITDDYKGGAKFRNIDGMKLANPNPFQSRLEELEPILFNNPKQEGKFTSYSRSCLHSARKQPVILTEEEMMDIDKEQPGFLKTGMENGTILKYGTDPSTPYYYMCPRYWCLQTNRPISEEDVRSGKCGKIIGRNDKEVKPGHYVFQFFDKAEHGTEENYIQHYPGFIEGSKHAEGLCMPCCFKNWNTGKQWEKRMDCMKKQAQTSREPTLSPGEPTLSPGEPTLSPAKPAQQAQEKEDYVYGPERFPMDNTRWGFLPYAIQSLLSYSNIKCQVSTTNTAIKPNTPCLLRHGVENSTHQSFIACMADLLFFGKKDGVPSIPKMKRYLMDEVLSLDSFLTYQNGQLVQVFSHAGESKTGEASKEIKAVYKKSKLYKEVISKESASGSRASSPIASASGSVSVNGIATHAFFETVVNAYENFIAFLKDDTVYIDYTYLWDLFSRPNDKLFPKGLNLVILELVNNDITNNVEIICPTSLYSKENFVLDRPSALIVYQKTSGGSYFEPIYLYKTEQTKVQITKTFLEKDTLVPDAIRNALRTVFLPTLNTRCAPLPSKPSVYKFRAPIQLPELISKAAPQGYTATKQVVNYQGAVIYVILKRVNSPEIPVPCAPSALLPNLPTIFMEDTGFFKNYAVTVDFLSRLYEKSEKSIACAPVMKVVEDGMVVGVLTQSNQFVLVQPALPVSETNDTLIPLKGNNYLKADLETQAQGKTVSAVDQERVDMIQKIQDESRYYQMYRNAVRILINKYENLKIRESMNQKIKSFDSYYRKMDSVLKLLKTLVKKAITFVDDLNVSSPKQGRPANDITRYSSCLLCNKETCAKRGPFCMYTKKDGCVLRLPAKNTLTGADNESNYVKKMADELIRYSLVYQYIFEPQKMLTLGDVNYNIRDNEMVIPQSLLTQDYFEDLISVDANPYVKYNTRYTVNPLQTEL